MIDQTKLQESRGFFPERDIRLAAVFDNTDTAGGENELAPIRKLFNDGMPAAARKGGFTACTGRNRLQPGRKKMKSLLRAPIGKRELDGLFERIGEDGQKELAEKREGVREQRFGIHCNCAKKSQYRNRRKNKKDERRIDSGKIQR